jgi:hypothetical protein
MLLDQGLVVRSASSLLGVVPSAFNLLEDVELVHDVFEGDVLLHTLDELKRGSFC